MESNLSFLKKLKIELPCDPARVSQVALEVKNQPANARDTKGVGSVPGVGRSPGGGHGSSLQCSCLKNLMDRGIWQATVQRVAKSQSQLKGLSTHAYF